MQLYWLAHMYVFGLRQLRIASSGNFAKLMMSSKKTHAHVGVLLELHAFARLRFDKPAVPDWHHYPSNGILRNETADGK